MNSLVTSPIEKELIYMSCLDHTVRVWDSSKTVNLKFNNINKNKNYFLSNKA